MQTLKLAVFALAFAGVLTACQTETEVEAPATEPVVEPAPIAPVTVDTMAMDTTMIDTTIAPSNM